MKKNLFTYLILIFAVSSAATLPFAKGFKYTSAEGKFSISFPGEFKTETTDQDEAKTVKTSATLGDLTYFASYTLHQIKMSEPESLAGTSLEAFTEATGGSITSQSEWKIKEHKGVKATISLEEQKSKIQYQVILVGQLQYQILVVAPNASWYQKTADTFFKSFKLGK